MGMAGVSAGIATTLGVMHAPAAVYAQVLVMLGAGVGAWGRSRLNHYNVYID